MSTDTIRLGDRIREVRERRKLSLAQLGRECGLDKSTLSRIEAGKVDPPWSTVEAIAKALGFQGVAGLATGLGKIR